MKKEKITYSFLILFFLNVTTLVAQQAVLSSGKEAVGSGGSVSYSVGQLACQTNNGTNGTVAEGVQQPYEISLVLDIDSANLPEKAIVVFPNPVSNNVTLKIDDFEVSTMFFQLYDSNGKLLNTGKIIGNETNIKLDNYPRSIYLLEVIKNNAKLKTFKIIKKE